MLDSGDGISDLVFSPGRPPQVERFGELVPVPIAELPTLRTGRHRRHRPRSDRDNETVLRTLKDTGSCRPVVRAARSLPLPRQRLPPARHVRDRHARDRARRSRRSQELGPAAGDRRLRDAQERHRARDRPDRLGQVVDAGRDHRPDQREPRRSHPHHRGSDRVPAPRTRRARSTSASCTPTRRRSRWRCGRRCARRRR